MKKQFVQGTRPPKLRFKPGYFIEIKGQLYEIIYAYRTQDDPHEWHFSLEERKIPSSIPTDGIGKYLHTMGFGSSVPRIVYDVFRDFEAVYQHFYNIPLNGNRIDLPNKTLVQEGKLIKTELK